MRRSFVFLTAVALIIASCDAATQPEHARVTVSSAHQRGVASDNRLLRSYEDDVEDEEERGWSLKSLFGAKKVKLPNHFTPDDLNKMLRSDSFKLEMFKKWDQHYTVGKIRESLKLDRSPGYVKLLLDYLNKFERATGRRK